MEHESKRTHADNQSPAPEAMNPQQEATSPPGRSPATGTDSGNAEVPSGGEGGTGTTGLAGIGTAGGTSSKDTEKKADNPGKSQSSGGNDPNDLGPAGDYSR